MSLSSSSAAAASASFSGEDIHRILQEKGNIVKAVLLRCPPAQSDEERRALHSNDGEKTSGGEGKPRVSLDVGQSKVVNEDTDVKCGASPHDYVKVNDNPNSEHDVRTSATEEALPACSTSAATEPVVEPAYNFLLEKYVEEVQIDTTPKERAVASLLTGDATGRITFLGQYETENTVVIARSENNNVMIDTKKVSEACDERRINPHSLQPPLHKWNGNVSGDILLMRVRPDADGDEEEFDESKIKQQKEKVEGSNVNDEVSSKQKSHTGKACSGESGSGEGDNAEKLSSSSKTLAVLSESNADDNSLDEEEKGEATFFQDYTKQEYISFAKRTDIPIPDEEESVDCEDEEAENIAEEALNGQDDDQQSIADDEADGEDDEDDEDDDEEYDPEEDEEGLLEESPMAMFHMVLGHLIRQFHEQNGRGPGSSELLRMRALLADKMGIELDGVTAVPSDEEDSHQEDTVEANNDNAKTESDKKDHTGEKSHIAPEDDGDASNGAACETNGSPAERLNKKRRREEEDDAGVKDGCNPPDSSNPKAKKRHKKRIHWNENLFHVQEIPAHLPSSDESGNEDENEVRETVTSTDPAEGGGTSASCAPLDVIETFVELKPGEQEV